MTIWNRIWSEAGAIGDVDPPAEATPAPAPTPVTLADDTLVIPPGGKDPVPFKDYQSKFKPAEEFDKLSKQYQGLSKAEQLIKRAEQIDAARRSGVQQAQPQPGARAAGTGIDQVLAAVKNKPFITGSDVAQLVQDLQRSNDPTKLYQWATTINQAVKTLADRFQSTDQRIGGFEEKEFNQQIGSVIDSGVTAVEIAMDAPELKGDPGQTLRTLAENFYYAFEPGQGQTRAQYNQEFPQRFAEHFEALRKAFRAADKVAARKSREQIFPGRGGGATPTGTTPNRRLSPRERARMFSRSSQDALADAV